MKLREGKTGEIVGNGVETKAEGPRLDGSAQRDIKNELIGAIDELDANHGGGDDDDADSKPKKTAMLTASWLSHSNCIAGSSRRGGGGAILGGGFQQFQR